MRIPFPRIPRNGRLLVLPFLLFAYGSCQVLDFLTGGEVDGSHFYQGTAPTLVNRKLGHGTQLLNYEAFALLHSSVTRTALWAAEHLTRDSVTAARALPRRNVFHPEARLLPFDRSELGDYEKSGYDRGHMAPSGNMPTATAQQQSFTLANMIPQNPNNNQHLWEAIESAVRGWALESGEVYVVTGPLFEGDELERLKGRILVPTHVYKAVFDPSKNQGAAYVTPNAPGMEYETMTLADMEARCGINLFPSVGPDVKAQGMVLPKPAAHNSSSRRSRK